MHKHKESQSEYIEISGKQLEGRTYRDSNFQQHSAGASILLEAMMHLPPVSDFPLFWKKFQTLWKIVPVLPFPDFFLDIFDFHRPKFMMTFFPLFQYISHLFRENYYSPFTFANVPPVFETFTCF